MNSLIVGPSPHIRSNNSTSKIMLNVIIATIPAMVASVIIFGARAAVVILACVSSCVFFEFLFRHVFKRKHTIKDLSAVVTGILLAFNLPVGIPLYIAVIGSFVAIIVVKEVFGGIGHNFANPAIVGRIVLALSFPAYMTGESAFALPFYYKGDLDSVTGATPLEAETLPSNMDLFLGKHGGCLGEVCVLAILIGLLYLFAMRIVRPYTPFAFVGTVALLSYIAGEDVLPTILTGGLMLGAVFMATDYTTNPMTPVGKIVFGVGCGLISFVIRQWGALPEGVAFSILTMNLLTPSIDRITRPKPFGIKEMPKEVKKEDKKEDETPKENQKEVKKNA